MHRKKENYVIFSSELSSTGLKLNIKSCLIKKAMRKKKIREILSNKVAKVSRKKWQKYKKYLTEGHKRVNKTLAKLDVYYQGPDCNLNSIKK